MRENDLALRNLLSFPEVFADLWQQLVFKNELVIRPDELQEVEDYLKPLVWDNDFDPDGEVVKLYRNGNFNAILHLMIQTVPDPQSVQRIGWRRYPLCIEQGLPPENRSLEEFPVIFPIVLYFGTSEWNEPASLQEYYRKHLNPEAQNFLSFLPDSKITLVDAGSLSDEALERLCPDLQAACAMVRHLRSHHDLPFNDPMIFKSGPFLRPQAALELLASYCDDPKILERIDGDLQREKEYGAREVRFEMNLALSDLRSRLDTADNADNADNTDMLMFFFSHITDLTLDPAAYQSFLEKRGLLRPAPFSKEAASGCKTRE